MGLQITHHSMVGWGFFGLGFTDEDPTSSRRFPNTSWAKVVGHAVPRELQQLSKMLMGAKLRVQLRRMEAGPSRWLPVPACWQLPHRRTARQSVRRSKHERLATKREA